MGLGTARKLGLDFRQSCLKSVATAAGSAVQILGAVTFQLCLGPTQVEVTAHLLPSFLAEAHLILGQDFMKSNHVVLNLGTSSCTLFEKTDQEVVLMNRFATCAKANLQRNGGDSCTADLEKSNAAPDLEISAATAVRLLKRNPDLMHGKVTQGHDCAARYAENFLTRARILPKESQAVLCGFFLAGLKPELRALCCLDRDNREWTSLQALVQHTFSEETRLRYHVAASLPASKQGKPILEEHVDRKRKHGTMAAASSAEGRPPRAVDLETPVEKCPLFGLVNSKDNKITDAQKKTLDSWGGCYRCKRGRHDAIFCKADPSTTGPYEPEGQRRVAEGKLPDRGDGKKGCRAFKKTARKLHW